MSQTSVNDEPVQAYEGKEHVSHAYPSTKISRLASELIYFGKAVCREAVTDVTVGDQQCRAPAAATDITDKGALLGVAVADPSLERLNDASGNPAPYGAYQDEGSVQIMKKGQIWVVTTALIADLSTGVYVRWDNAGGSPPAEALGSFANVASAEHALVPDDGAQWIGAVAIGGVNFGLLELNLP